MTGNLVYAHHGCSLQLDNKPPGHTYKNISSQNNQISVTAAASASNPAGFSYTHSRNNVLETQDSGVLLSREASASSYFFLLIFLPQPTPEWTVRPVGYAPTSQLTDRSPMSVDTEYIPDPQLKHRRHLTVSYGLAAGIARVREQLLPQIRRCISTDRRLRS